MTLNRVDMGNYSVVSHRDLTRTALGMVYDRLDLTEDFFALADDQIIEITVTVAKKQKSLDKESDHVISA